MENIGKAFQAVIIGLVLTSIKTANIGKTEKIVYCDQKSVSPPFCIFCAFPPFSDFSLTGYYDIGRGEEKGFCHWRKRLLCSFFSPFTRAATSKNWDWQKNVAPFPLCFIWRLCYINERRDIFVHSGTYWETLKKGGSENCIEITRLKTV